MKEDKHQHKWKIQLRTANCWVTLYETLVICSYPRSLHWVAFLCMSSSLFHVCFKLIKNWKERESLVKSITWETGRKNLWVNTQTWPCFTRMYWFKNWKPYGQQNRTRCHYTTLPGSMTSHDKHTHTPVHSKIMVTALCSWQTKLEDGFTKNNWQTGLLPKHIYMYCWLDNYVHGHIDISLMFNQVLSTLYITHGTNYSRPLPPFQTGSSGKLGRAWERGYWHRYTVDLEIFVS